MIVHDLRWWPRRVVEKDVSRSGYGEVGGALPSATAEFVVGVGAGADWEKRRQLLVAVMAQGELLGEANGLDERWCDGSWGAGCMPCRGVDASSLRQCVRAAGGTVAVERMRSSCIGWLVAPARSERLRAGASIKWTGARCGGAWRWSGCAGSYWERGWWLLMTKKGVRWPPDCDKGQFMDRKKTKKDREREAGKTKKEEKIEDKHHGTIFFLHPSQPMAWQARRNTKGIKHYKIYPSPSLGRPGKDEGIEPQGFSRMAWEVRRMRGV
ncbi:hypothetical protein B0H13DRAFT_1854783 [Mycena leptocephala]|nr:hypothetical protein B0H13DRAFT_1854783 [Mycena leptocephala]